MRSSLASVHFLAVQGPAGKPCMEVFPQGKSYAAAIGFLATFDADVASRAGSLIPNRWSAAAPATENVAGQLDSLSKVAQFHLGRLNGTR